MNHYAVENFIRLLHLGPLKAANWIALTLKSKLIQNFYKGLRLKALLTFSRKTHNGIFQNGPALV